MSETPYESYVSTEEAARRLGMLAKSLNNRCLRGTIKARKRKIEGEMRWQVAWSEVLDLLDERQDGRIDKHEAAAILGIDPDSIKWHRRTGRLTPILRRAGNREYAYDPQQVRELAKEMAIPVGHLTPKQAAARMETTLTSIYQLAAKGRLKRRKEGRFVYIPADSVELRIRQVRRARS